MSWSEMEDRYLNRLAEQQFPTMPEEPPQVAAAEPDITEQMAVGTPAAAPDIGGRVPEMTATPRNPLLGGVSDFVRDVRGLANQYEIKDWVPLLGGLGVGDLLIGKSPEEIEEWAYGNAPMRVPEMSNVPIVKTGRKGQLADTMFLGADAAGIGKAAGTLGKIGAKAAKNIVTDIATTPPRGSIGLAPDAAAILPNVVSTRLPTAVKATENPMTGELLSDLTTMKRDPDAFKQNVNLIREYPNFTSKARNPEKQADDFITSVKDNLLYLYDRVPEGTRNRSRLWYDGARNIVDRWGSEYSQPDQALAGVLAVLSPQKDWFMNVSLGNRVVDIALNKKGFQWDSAMDDMSRQIWKDPKYDPVLALVRNKRYEELQTPAEKALWLRTYDQAFNPPDHKIVTPEGGFADVRLTQSGKPYRVAWGSLNEIGKAVSILDNPSIENISTRLGSQHKVRNFYNNIYSPNDPRGHVTIDTHAVAAGLMRPLSGNSKEVAHNFGSGVVGERGPANSSVTGAQGTYGIYAEAYRRAAAERGVLPREMQSITWEAVRGLFPDTYKTSKNAELIDSIWLQYRKGKLSLEEARNAVIESAGGINPPEWERAGFRSGVTAKSAASGDQGELLGTGISGRGANRPGRNNPTAGNPSTVTGGQAPEMGAE